MPPPVADSRRIVVVGPCAAGKSTLVAGLRDLGYDASVCAQEHSEIPTLWRHTEPDVLIALQVDLPTLRQRRHAASWPEDLYHLQQRRLSPAMAAADVLLETSGCDAGAVLAWVRRWLERGRRARSRPALETPG